MLIAKITDGNRTECVTIHPWALCPRVSGYKPALAYYESRYELFMWACETAGMNPYECEWIDGKTLEVFRYEDLETEYFDMMEEE